MIRIMPSTPDAREALNWIEGRLGNGWAVTVQQRGVGLPVEWTPHRWAHLVDDLHVAPFRVCRDELLVCIALEGWNASAEYLAVDTLEIVIVAERK